MRYIPSGATIRVTKDNAPHPRSKEVMTNAAESIPKVSLDKYRKEVLTPESVARVTEAARAAVGRDPLGSELVPALVLLGRMSSAEREAMLAQWAEFVRMFGAAEQG